MKKILALSLALTALTGCSTSDSTDEILSTITHALLNGTWKSECVIDGSTSYIATGTFNDGKATFKATTYSDTTCTTMSADEPAQTSTYTIGKDVTVDGSVAGITTATELDLIDTTPGASPAGEKSYNIFAIKDLITLYAGDDTGANDGTTVAKRPTKLWNVKFSKQ
jgi:hypothetical protein